MYTELVRACNRIRVEGRWNLIKSSSDASIKICINEDGWSCENRETSHQMAYCCRFWILRSVLADVADCTRANNRSYSCFVLPKVLCNHMFNFEHPGLACAQHISVHNNQGDHLFLQVEVTLVLGVKALRLCTTHKYTMSSITLIMVI